MAKLGVGVVGVGTMGRQHAQNLRCLIPEARLIAVADADAKRAEQAAAELEIEHFYGSVEALVERKDIQAVVIVTPAKFHGVPFECEARAGRDSFLKIPSSLHSNKQHRFLNLPKRVGF